MQKYEDAIFLHIRDISQICNVNFMFYSLKKILIYFKSKHSIHLLILVIACGVVNTVSAQDHFDFNYPDRAGMIQAGWDFVALTPSGSPRNTEQMTGAIVSYDQEAHPGVVRIPADVGDLSGGANNTRNTIFRDLPARWTSIRIKIASFAPSQNYQQAGLAVYQDDNNYLQFTRRFDGNNCIKLLKEVAGTSANVNTINLSTTTNLYLRLDRDPSTEYIAAYYSLDGSYWNYIASTTYALNNPRFAIVTGASPSGFPNADIAWAEMSYQAPVSGDVLFAHPRELVFNALEGNSLPDIRSIFLSSGQGGILDWNLTTDASWLTPNLQNGVTDDILKVGVNTGGMSSGIYHGNIVLESPESSGEPVIIPVTLIINPDVPVRVTTWKNGRDAAMSVSVDDSQPSGFDALQANGFKGTYVLQGVTPPSYFADYYNAGMELGSHTVHHYCETVTNDVLRTSEIEPNISALCTKTPQPCKDVITLVWPCGYTNYREQTIASDYFICARGYMINKFEDSAPENFMNLKSYNSHEHPPFPPADFKTLVDQAVTQHKWYNLVLHDLSNDDGAITYASTKNIWVASVGTVTKYILQRERFILTDFNESTTAVTYNVSRLPIASSAIKNFELAFGSNDSTTIQVDIDDSKTVENVFINGGINHYQIKSLSGNLVLLTNVKLESSTTKTIEVRYVDPVKIHLSIAGITANNKVYDRTSLATINTGGASLVGVVPGDDVILVTSGATGTFSDKTVGISKTVSCSGFTIAGTDAPKYYLSQPFATAGISAVSLTISGVTANNKVYDRTTTATLNTGSSTLSGVLTGDIVTLVKTGASGTFVNKNTGTAKIVSINGFTLGGNDAGNYILNQPTAAANITAATLTVSGVTANNKLYDGTTAATLNIGGATLAGILVPDVVIMGSTGVTGTFDNVNVGTGKSVSISGFTISGTDAGNYSLIQPATTASITGLPLTITGVTANNRVYNGTTIASLITGSAALVGVLGGDVVNLVSAGASGVFVNKNVGMAKSVSTTGFTLSGPDATKYTVIQPTATATITSANLTVTGVIANNKVYNGTAEATLRTSGAILAGVFGSDVVNLVSTSATGLFSNKNTGTGKTVSTLGFTLTGIDSENYILTQPTTTGNITAATLTVSGVTVNDKIYDASTAATIKTGSAIMAGVLGNDDVTLVSTSATATFSTKNAGTAKTVLISGFTLSGNDAGNYTLTQPTATATISPANMSVSGITAKNRLYNGTATAALNITDASPEGVIGTDFVSLVFLGASGTFIDKNVGTAKSVSVSGITLGGTEAGNYTVIQPVTTADISPAVLTISGVTANNKVYDGTVTTVLNTWNASLTGIFESDAVSLVSADANGMFASEDAGAHKPVAISGFSIKGQDANNYILTQPSSFADITIRTLTLTAKDLNKSYGATLNFTGTEYATEGLIDGDIITGVTLSSPGAQPSAHIGTYDIVISGGSNSNYFINHINGTLTIDKSVLIVTADDKTRSYGIDNPALSITYSGFINGDDASRLAVPPVAETDAEKNSDVGDYEITLFGGSDNNYNFIYNTGILSIKRADQVIIFEAIPGSLRMTKEYQLNATASSGLPVSFECSDPNKASINGNILTVLEDGNLIITAHQEGDHNWSPANDLAQSVETLPTFDNISSLFTPNSDGMNDRWYIPDLEQYGRIQVTVYNRFGQVVYKSDSYKNDWDGTWHGNPLPSAAYYYIIKSSEKGFLKGVVNIVR
jgi:gliding motility-associated-like protein